MHYTEEERRLSRSGLVSSRGTALFHPICGNDIYFSYDTHTTTKAYTQDVFNPLFILLCINVIAFSLTLVFFFFALLKHWRFILTKAIYLFPALGFGVLVSGAVTMLCLIEWINTPLPDWLETIKYRKFLSFYIISIVLVINSIAVMMAMILSTLRMKLLDAVSLWVMLLVTGLKVFLSSFFFLLNRNMTPHKVILHLASESKAIQAYFNVFLKLLMPSFVIAATLFVLTYKSVMSYKRRTKSAFRRPWETISRLFKSSVPALIRSTSENSNVEYLNRQLEITPTRSSTTSNSIFKFSRLMLLPLVPVYLFSTWLTLSWLVLDEVVEPWSFTTHFKDGHLNLREYFFIFCQITMFVINFITLLLCLNFILLSNNLRRSRNNR